jgi:hypothetical protein
MKNALDETRKAEFFTFFTSTHPGWLERHRCIFDAKAAPPPSQHNTILTFLNISLD